MYCKAFASRHMKMTRGRSIKSILVSGTLLRGQTNVVRQKHYPHCKCWKLGTDNISSIERLHYPLKLRENRSIDNQPISVNGLIFIRTFLYHNAHYLSANGRQLFGSTPQKISVILHFSPFSSNERLDNLLLVHGTGKIRCLQLQCE